MIPDTDFWIWVYEQPVTDDPRGDFIGDTVILMDDCAHWTPDTMHDAVLCGCDEAWTQYIHLQAEYDDAGTSNLERDQI